ncbi:hypothetical protein HRR83_005982 [Exophiala dermatitidis]|uniref:Uncharacterized protein n=1 Tax=Exophiala dermatitidis TaxID=5970 RepID=A0AAN6EPS0_EXODE|nr:hypothetical protein HRR74_005379 [Exophiala dermatitidis]KAJ4517406.1 hypothetical protein HRR73_004458 [Exophiala dermatitidis]KAJ4548843.1 hypothetical protein HRR76_001422 [Exophiala dermatitidis]KAJ4552436.1 hypothetical protein HRR77_002448 [Exophiala dermatitidis]KAJ4566948.1 hypothetical protein HRR81_007024 [Exophiala dermatitidis]
MGFIKLIDNYGVCYLARSEEFFLFSLVNTLSQQPSAITYWYARFCHISYRYLTRGGWDVRFPSSEVFGTGFKAGVRTRKGKGKEYVYVVMVRVTAMVLDGRMRRDDRD